MSIPNPRAVGIPRGYVRRLALLALLIPPLLAAGCAAHERAGRSANRSAASPEQSADSAADAAPEAKIHIIYADKRDSLSSLFITKYSSAHELASEGTGNNGTASIVRFDGGVIVWQIDADKSLLGGMALLGGGKQYAPEEVKYANVPKGFVQSVPAAGSSEPLEPGRFYVFTVTRASGSASYEAAKVRADGSLEVYEAEPRAGSSYRLCCGVSSEFTNTLDSPLDANPAAP